jgi:hypothetical protein
MRSPFPMLLVRGATCALLVGAALGCGAPPPPAQDPSSSDGRGEREDRAAGPSFESEVGGLNEAQVKQTFERAASKLSACFAKGTERLPYLGGEVHFMVCIKKDGTPRFAFVKDSNLGDRTTEECMLGVFKAISWPKPQGGDGLAENSYTFEPSADERPPVEWSPEQLGKPFRKAQASLSQCRTSAGAGALKATMYVEPSGKPSAVGVSGADEKADAAADCVISALKALTFPSPGSYAAKVSVTID